MNQPIKYRGPFETTFHTDGVLVDGLGPNQYAIKVGQNFVTLDRNGSLRFTATTMGAWEGSFTLSDKTNVLTAKPSIVTYNIEIGEL